MGNYIIITDDKKYFVRINELNKIVFTNNEEEATIVSYDDAKELISLIECSGYVVKTNIV